MRILRAYLIVALCLILAGPVIVIQGTFLLVWPAGARWFPVYVYRLLIRLLGARVTLKGELVDAHPALIASSHSSWIDILAINSLGPVCFVAKREVSEWPLIGLLAKLQRTAFVDRTSRISTRDATDEIADRLLSGDRMVLFPEGTSSDGNRVLPFKSAIIGAVEKAFAKSEIDDVLIQPMAVAFVRRRGLPISRVDRPYFTWFGDMEFMPHFWGALMHAPVEIVISVSKPLRHSEFGDRKALTRRLEMEVRRMLLSLLLGRELDYNDVALVQDSPVGQPA